MIRDLSEQAAERPAAALARAQSLAPGLPDVAIATIDAVFARLPEASREELCRTAMEVLSRVGDIKAGWPRQIAVAQTFYAGRRPDSNDKSIRDGFTEARRLPVSSQPAAPRRSGLDARQATLPL